MRKEEQPWASLGLAGWLVALASCGANNVPELRSTPLTANADVSVIAESHFTTPEGDRIDQKVLSADGAVRGRTIDKNGILLAPQTPAAARSIGPLVSDALTLRLKEAGDADLSVVD